MIWSQRRSVELRSHSVDAAWKSPVCFQTEERCSPTTTTSPSRGIRELSSDRRGTARTVFVVRISIQLCVITACIFNHPVCGKSF